jgi:threonine dehydratase
MLEAAARISSLVRETPLARFHADGRRDVRLKAECLQATGSFKLRCAANIVAAAPAGRFAHGVVTASAGNFAPALACALAASPAISGEDGGALTVHVPDSIGPLRRRRLEAVGATIVAHPFEDWWRIMEADQAASSAGAFVHAVWEPDGLVGNGTMALEIISQWPEVDTVVAPIGGGGLICGLALAFQALKPDVRVLGAEIATAAPVMAALVAGRPVDVERGASFAHGVGRQRVLARMWPRLRELVGQVIVVSEADTQSAMRHLVLDAHLVVEPPAAIALAAAISPDCPGKNIVAILSGGNIEAEALARVLQSVA